jgi:DNA-directed RNA polymerase specialized sigma24 family protein
MRDSDRRQARWALTGQALDGLLARLDDDRDRAALRYEQLRSRLQALFGWWGTENTHELADRTLDRVAAKLQEGAVVPASSLPAYLRGAARLVYYESLREAEREENAQRQASIPGDADVQTEETLRALDACLETVPSADRELILDYYSASGGSNISARRSLAGRLAMSATALRIRAHRLRQRLEECVRARLQAAT